MEVVQLRDGATVALRPCPPWCIESRHFVIDIIDSDDGYHHYGPEIAVPTSDRFMLDGPNIVVNACLASWTCPAGAEPGPAHIKLGLGTAEETATGASADLTPSEARAVAHALLDLADVAEREGPQ